MSTTVHEDDEVRHCSKPNLVWRLEGIRFWLAQGHAQSVPRRMSSEVNRGEQNSFGEQEPVECVQ